MRAQLKWVVGLNTFEMCVTNADGTQLVQLTDNALFEGRRDVAAPSSDRLTIPNAQIPISNNSRLPTPNDVLQWELGIGSGW